MLSYAIVGSGYRSVYYARIAAQYPDLFRAMYLCRSEEKALKMHRLTGLDAAVSPEAVRAFRPDFIVVAVDRPHVAEVTEEWVRQGYAVVAETPVGASVEQLNRLWSLHREQGARIVCCEQYHRYPILQAGLSAVDEGLLGEPVSAYLSLAHDYHGFSLIHRMLRTRGEGWTMRGTGVTAPVVQTDSRGGAILDGSTAAEERHILHITFDSGKTAVYDFASVQYRSFIRCRHLTVRGSRGEWSDCLICRVDAEGRPQRQFLMPEIPTAYRVLDNQTLRDRRKTWQAELFLDTAQDEFAVASILMDMEAYLAGGPSPYPLEDALEDAYFWLMSDEAAANSWQEYRAQPMPWRCL